MPKIDIENFKKQIMSRFFATLLEQEKNIRKSLDALKENSSNAKFVELQIKKLNTTLEKLAQEIHKANQSYAKQKQPTLETMCSMIIMHTHMLSLLAKTFTTLRTLKLFDEKLIQKAHHFISMFEEFRATHKKTFKVIKTDYINYQTAHEDALTHSVIIRDYILAAKKNSSDVEYLDNVLTSIISLNKIMQLRKNQTLKSNFPYFLELLLKKIDLAKFYLTKGHFKIAIDYLEKTIPLFQLLNENQKQLSNSSSVPDCKSEVELFTLCKKDVHWMYLKLSQNLNEIAAQHSELYATILYTRIYQVMRRCLGQHDPIITENDASRFNTHAKNLNLLFSQHFDWEVNTQDKLIHFHCHQNYFQPSIFDKFQNTVHWSYQNHILTLKNAYEISPSLFGETVRAIQDHFDAMQKLNEMNEAIKAVTPLVINPLTTQQTTAENNNNTQTNDSETNENNEKKPKVKTRGIEKIEEPEQKQQEIRPPNTYKASELGFPKQYEKYTIRELTGADLPDGVFYGIYDFHPDDQGLRKLGMTKEQLTQYENKFDEAQLFTDSKTGIIITKNKDFHVDVYDPKTTQTDTPKVTRNIHLHTGLKISISKNDPRIEAQPLCAIQTAQHVPVLWGFFKPTIHTNDNIKISSTNDSCNNNQTTVETKDDITNSPN